MTLRTLDRDGFTLVEIMAVLVIIGIVAAVAVTKSIGASNQTLVTETELLKTNLRYAQSRALGDDVAWGMSFLSNGYTITKTGGSAVLPYDNKATHNFGSGISISVGAGSSVSFDRWGSPGASNVTVTLSNGKFTQTITITENTGFIS